MFDRGSIELEGEHGGDHEISGLTLLCGGYDRHHEGRLNITGQAPDNLAERHRDVMWGSHIAYIAMLAHARNTVASSSMMWPEHIATGGSRACP